ncbi:MAG: hypothetical protein KDD63_15280 [Bacteroidetes bacterium]|nr:hypothetical protein [Bacteroidota bacterium]MCB0853587.1 hypothetical protein [Bacteroidota bacterium]
MKTIRILSFFLLTGTSLWLAGCQLEDPTVGIETREVIELVPDATNLLADGQSRMVVRAILGPETDANAEITFRTEQGIFAGAEGFPNSNNGQEFTRTASGKEATAVLVADRTANPSVTLSVSVTSSEASPATYSDFEFLTFERAYPEEMLITTDNAFLSVEQGSSLDVKVLLLRAEGNVSNKTRINFSVSPVDTSQAEVEIVPFDFASGDSLLTSLRNRSTNPGKIMLEANVKDENGAIVLSESIIIEVK